MHLNKAVFLICSFIFVGCLNSCTDESYESIKRNRAILAETNIEEILIGVAWPDADSNFVKGINLAVKKINQEGGIFNRPFKIILNTAEKSLSDLSLSTSAYQDKALEIAYEFANNPRMIAVIGHLDSKTALLTSNVYENMGLLYLASNVTNIKLTSHSFDYVFRTLLNNQKFGSQIADFIVGKGYKNIAILHDRGIYADELANVFAARIEDNPTAKIVFRRSFFKQTIDLTTVIIDLKKAMENDLDIIFIATKSYLTEKIYAKSRDMGVRLPFVGGETLDTENFLSLVKDWERLESTKKTIIPMLFNETLPKNQGFIQLFKQEYGEDLVPNQLAALGYDNIMLLAHAIKQSQSTVPIIIANSLRYMEPCNGVTGTYQFSEDGDLITKNLYFKELQQDSYKITQMESVKTGKIIENCNEIDRDNDSIPNNLDACPDNKKIELSGGITLTGIFRGCPLDIDRDLVPNYRDKCLENTREELAKGADETGCPRDTDKDKTPDYLDACPDNPNLIAFVGGKHCQKDQDKDDITDDIDECQNNTAIEISKGVNKQGCPIDTDADGKADYVDACANNTPVEISLGVKPNGCPADKDQDGILDYQDRCLATPNKVIIDEYGCGIFETSIMLQPLTNYFKTGRSMIPNANKNTVLTNKGKAYLDTLVMQLNRKPLKSIEIIVHGENKIDSVAINDALPVIQAFKISEYLQIHGIDSKKIIIHNDDDAIKASLKPKTNQKDWQKNSHLEIIIKQFRPIS